MYRGRGKLLLLLVVFTTAACGSNAPAADLQPSTSAAAPTAILQQKLDALVAAGAPAAVAEVTDGAQRWSAAAGQAVRGRPRTAAPADAFRIAGITTSMIAADILQLVDQKQLTLDTSVDDILPYTLSKSVTIRQLLEHSSGLPDYVSQLAPATVDAILTDRDIDRTDSELVDTAQNAGWTQVPGASYSYSDTNYIVLGEVIEAIEGVSVGESLQQRIFGPAGMTSTTYPDSSAMPDNALNGYLVSGGVYTDITSFTPTFWSSAGAVVSTVGDVNRFFRALFAGKLFPRYLVSQMQQPPEVGSGLGISAATDECRSGADDLVFGQRGNGFGYRSLSYATPDGRRQVTLAWTASSPSLGTDALDATATAALDAGLGMTCPSVG